MRVMIAGGAGFVGSHLARRLVASGCAVTIVDNLITGTRANLRALRRDIAGDRLEIVIADVCDPIRLRGRLDAVCHLASPASPVHYLRHPLSTLDAGSLGTRRLLELARDQGARFLLASTSEVYGDPQVHPQPESYWGHVNPIGPRSVYDEAKRFAEAMTTAYGRHEGVPVRIARIFNTYGPGMRLDDGRVIPTFVQQALLHEPLSVFGDGSQTRSYCFVADLVAGLERLLWSELAGPVNLGNDDEHTVLDTAKRVVALTESRSEIHLHPLPQDDPRLRRPDLERARAELRWEPRVPFEEGLRITVDDLVARLRSRAPAPAAERSSPQPASGRRTRESGPGASGCLGPPQFDAPW